MRLVETASGLDALPRAGRRAVVMTMGALHEGHLTLVRRAREIADQVVVTVFVNPLQFTEAADLERYPRTLEADCALLEPEGVDAVYAPDTGEVYPAGEPVVTVSAGAIGRVFEGEFRPGHFDGMLTVVLKLMHLTRPDVALYGQKDAQQLIAIRAMVADLNVPVEVVAVPTVRDADGLALSSRNVFLSPDERREALVLHRSLAAAAAAAGEGADVDGALAAGAEVLAAHPVVAVEYLAALDPVSSQAVPSGYRGDVVIAVAARVGGTRLIDNLPMRIRGGKA